MEPDKKSLYDYQRRAVENLRTGSILCGGVGSGKSLTALEYYSQLVPERQLYVITTARKRDTKDWEKEAENFSFPPPIVDSWNNIKKYARVKGAFFIFDEQRVIGSGKWVRVFLNITKQNDWILLSATPGDTWLDYIPVFVANRFFLNRSEFLLKHVQFKRFSSYPIIESYINEEKLEELKTSILVNMDYVRPTSSVFNDVSVDYEKGKLEVIRRLQVDPYSDKPIKTPAEFLFVSRRIVNSDPSRFGAVCNLLDKHRKLIVFYNYDYELNILRELERNTVIGEWNGHKHEPVPSAESWVYLVQYLAGAEGWNCIETNAMVFYSLNYSYRIMRQSAGRIDRLNTPYANLYYYHLVSRSWVDLAILEALNRKRNFNLARWERSLASETWAIIEGE